MIKYQKLNTFKNKRNTEADIAMSKRVAAGFETRRMIRIEHSEDSNSTDTVMVENEIPQVNINNLPHSVTPLGAIGDLSSHHNPDGHITPGS